MISKIKNLFKKKETEAERIAREYQERLKLEEFKIRLAKEYEELQRKEEERKRLAQKEHEAYNG